MSILVEMIKWWIYQCLISFIWIYLKSYTIVIQVPYIYTTCHLCDELIKDMLYINGQIFIPFLLFNLIQINKSLWTMSAFLISFWKFNLTMSFHSRRKLFACIYSLSSFLYIFTAMSKLFKKIIFAFENKTLRLILVLVRLNTL